MTARACQARAKLGGQARLTSMRRPDGIISPAGKDTTDESYKRREPFSGEVNIAVERSSLGPAIAVVRQPPRIPACEDLRGHRRRREARWLHARLESGPASDRTQKPCRRTGIHD